MNTFPKTVEQLPVGEFFAILKPSSVTIPGDERSRTNPGHGYPEHSVDYWDIEVFPTKEKWEKEIERLTLADGYYKQKFKAVIMRPVSVRMTVKVEVG